MNDYRVDRFYGDSYLKDRKLIDFVNYINSFHIRKAVRQFLEIQCYYNQYSFEDFVDYIAQFEKKGGYIDETIPGLTPQGYRSLKKILIDFIKKNELDIRIPYRVTQILEKGAE